MAGHIRIHGPFPPPAGVLGPDARRTASHVYQVFDEAGRKLVGGTSGADREVAVALARRVAAEKGLAEPTIEFVPPAGEQLR